MNPTPPPARLVLCAQASCGNFSPGHEIHFIHAKRVTSTPWGWRDAIVTRLDGLEIALSYVHEDGTPLLWHHRPLHQVLAERETVRLHEKYNVIGVPAGWFNVDIEHRIGDIPHPDEPGLWAAEMTVAIVDLSTGIALATDHQDGTSA